MNTYNRSPYFKFRIDMKLMGEWIKGKPQFNDFNDALNECKRLHDSNKRNGLPFVLYWITPSNQQWAGPRNGEIPESNPSSRPQAGNLRLPHYGKRGTKREKDNR